MLRKLLFAVVILCLSLDSYSQKLGNRDMHNALLRRDYDKIINAINSGSDPLAPIITGGGGRRKLHEVIMGKAKGGASGTDLLEKILSHENSEKRDQIIALIREKGQKSSLIGFWHLMDFLKHTHNLKDTVTLKWIIDKKDDPAVVALGEAVEMRYNPFINYTAKKYGWSAIKTHLVRYGFCSDSTELVEAMINKYGVYPRRKYGIKAIDVLESQFGDCRDDYKWIITKLWDGGSRFDQRNHIKETIQENAVRTKDLLLLKQLDDLTDISLNVVNAKKQNLLHQAAALRQMELMQYLIDRGVSLKAKDIYGKYPHDYAYEWDFEVRKLLGDKLSVEEQNTMFLTQIAKRAEESITDGDREKIKSIIGSDQFMMEVLQSTRSDISMKKLKPNYKELIDIAEENRSWYLFAQLYRNQKWKYKPVLYYKKFYDNKESFFFEYMIPLNVELGEDLFDKMIDRWSLEPQYLRDVIFKSYLIRKEMNGLISFEDPNGKSLLEGRTFEEIGDLYPGYAKAKQNSKVGVVAIDGEILIPFEFDSIYSANIPGLNAYYATKGDKKLIFEIQSKNGFETTLKEEIAEDHILKERVFVNKSAYYIVESSGKYGLYKQFIDGLYLNFEPEYDEIKAVTYYHIAFRKGEKWAVGRFGSSTPKLKFKYQDVKAVKDIEVQVKRKGNWESFR